MAVVCAAAFVLIVRCNCNEHVGTVNWRVSEATDVGSEFGRALIAAFLFQLATGGLLPSPRMPDYPRIPEGASINSSMVTGAVILVTDSWILRVFHKNLLRLSR